MRECYTGCLKINSKERHERRYQRRKEARTKKVTSTTETYDNLNRAVSFNALLDGYAQSRKGVSWKGSVQRYGINRFRNTVKIREQISKGKNITKGFTEFTLRERGKVRHIKSVHISERCVQRALCDRALVPVLSRSLIHYNGASLKGKGIKFSVDGVKKHLQRYYRKHGADGYVLMMDFKGYFDNILHEPIYESLEKKFTDKGVRGLTRQFIEPFGAKSLGLGSQVSQILAVHYTNKIDHLIKQELRIKLYGRYMDDCYLIHPSKDYLKGCQGRIRAECDKVGIVLNQNKTQIVKLSKGFKFLKTRFYLTDTGKVILKPCRDSVVRMRRKLKAFKPMVDRGEMEFEDVRISYNSWRGYVMHKNTYRTVQNMDKLFVDLFDRSWRK